MKDLNKRVLSAVIGSILLVLVLCQGGMLLSLATYVISIIGLLELYKAVNSIDIKSSNTLGILITTVLFFSFIKGFTYLGLSIFIVMLLLLFNILIKNKNIQDMAVTIFGVLYVPFSLFHIILLDKTEYIWLIFIIAFGTDIFAYFAGNLFGKTKLWPKVSPKKTVEGSLGGIAGSIMLTLLFCYIFKIRFNYSLGILAIFGSIISQMGDLVASKIKRTCGIKDYGKIMPGHGGVLDRFDSIIFVSPVIYYYINIILNLT